MAVLPLYVGQTMFVASLRRNLSDFVDLDTPRRSAPAGAAQPPYGMRPGSSAAFPGQPVRAVLRKLAPNPGERHGVGPAPAQQVAILAGEIVAGEAEPRVRRRRTERARRIGEKRMAVFDEDPEGIVADSGDLGWRPSGQTDDGAFADRSFGGDDQRPQPGRHSQQDEPRAF